MSGLFKLLSGGVLMLATHSVFAGAYCAIVEKQKDCQYATWKACKTSIGDKGQCVINSSVSPQDTPSDFVTRDTHRHQLIHEGKTAAGSGIYCPPAACAADDYACKALGNNSSGQCR